jgi:putative tryptophan/tyrosine transport system substrate-binding protein
VIIAGDLSVGHSRKFKLIIKLKTAKALSITVPLSLIGPADEIIE